MEKALAEEARVARASPQLPNDDILQDLITQFSSCFGTMIFCKIEKFSFLPILGPD